jgi:hypothetical protein
MGLWLTCKDEKHKGRPRESGDPRPLDFRSPVVAGDKFRGNDVIFERAKRGISLWSGNNARLLSRDCGIGMTGLQW